MLPLLPLRRHGRFPLRRRLWFTRPDFEHNASPTTLAKKMDVTLDKPMTFVRARGKTITSHKCQQIRPGLSTVYLQPHPEGDLAVYDIRYVELHVVSMYSLE